MSWYRFDPARGELTLQVLAQPGAKQPGVEVHGADAIKVRIAAPAVDGRANAALCELIAARLGVAKSKVAVTRGLIARRKTLRVEIDRFDPALLCDAASKS
jgi:uncharacterized protein (TIGR00251 family)